MVPADTLFRAYLDYLRIDLADQPHEFEIHLLDSGHLSNIAFYKLAEATKKDLELQELHKDVMSGWPWTKEETPVETRPHWNYRDEITCYEGSMLKAGHSHIYFS